MSRDNDQIIFILLDSDPATVNLPLLIRLISVSETTTFVIYGHTSIYIYIPCLKFIVRE